MKPADIQQLKEVLLHCRVYPECNGCPYDFMEDHGELCYPVMAKYAYEYIRMLEDKINESNRTV